MAAPAIPAIGLVVVLALLLPRPAGALDLPGAIASALERNEVPGIARERLAQARARHRRAIARLLPSVVATGSFTRREEIFRDVGGGQRLLVQAPEAFGATVTGAARLIDPPAIPLVTAASREARAQAHLSEELRRELAFSVAETYVSVLAAEAIASAAERRIEVAEQAVDVARQRLEAGLGNRNDLTRTELALSDARLSATNAREAVALARIALEYLIVDEITGPLAEVAVPLPEEPPDPELARSRRPDLLALALQADAAGARALEPWLRLLPSLDLQATWRATDQPGFTGSNTDWNLGLTLVWEIYDGGARYADADLFGAQARELRLQTRALERRVDRDVAEAEARLERAIVASEEAAVRARIAAQNADEIEARFRAGLATALEQADAIASRFVAEAESANEVLRLEIERLALRNALGLWPLPAEEVVR